MVVLFSKPCRIVQLANKDPLVFDLGNNQFCDIHGVPVPAMPEYYPPAKEENDAPWEGDLTEDQGLDERLISKSITEIKFEVDDAFGCFGFQNRSGEFVIEPQYAFAREFTCGLAAVNINRTWYRTADGNRCYENHYGYINARGETVIPFAYDEAWPFNKYGVAVVEDRKNSYLIDTAGNVIPGTEKLCFEHYYDYDSRFFEFTLRKDHENYNSDSSDEILVGVYDTKDRRILLLPSIESFTEFGEDLILVDGGSIINGVREKWFVNSKGETVFPWLKGKGFAFIGRPNQNLVTNVAVVTRTGRGNRPVYLHGLYNANGRFIVPMEYETIVPLTEYIFSCVKDGISTVVELEEGDFV